MRCLIHLLLRLLASRGAWDMEWLDGFFKAGTDTATQLILFEILLRCVLMVWHQTTGWMTVYDTSMHDLSLRPEWGVILKLQGCLLLIFTHSVGDNAWSRRHIMVMYWASRRFQLADDRGFLIHRLVICIILLQLIGRGEGQRGGLNKYWLLFNSICLLYFV